MSKWEGSCIGGRRVERVSSKQYLKAKYGREVEVQMSVEDLVVFISLNTLVLV